MEFTYQGDPLDHVLDMTADGADCGQLLPVTPPLIHTQLKQTDHPLNSTQVDKVCLHARICQN